MIRIRMEWVGRSRKWKNEEMKGKYRELRWFFEFSWGENKDWSGFFAVFAAC